MINAILPNCDIRAMEGIIHSLGKRKIPIIGLSAKKNCAAFHSRYVVEKIISPSPKDENKFLDFLINEVPKGVLFASNDHTTILFSEHRELLTQNGFLTNFPSQAALLNGFDKWQCYLQATKFGIPSAYTQLIDASEQLDKIAESMPYPFIIKPTTLAGGNYIKVDKKEEIYPAYDKMNLLINLAENKVLKPKLIAQEWLTYDMEDIWCVEAYYSQDGKTSGVFPIKKMRTVIYREGTYGSRLYAGEYFPNERLEKLTKGILDSLEWKGLANTDWVYSKKRDTYFLTEINPRLPGFSFFPSQAGFEMAYFYYADITGEPWKIPKAKPALYFEVIRYPGDVSSTISVIWRKQYTWAKFIRSYLRIFTEKKPVVIDFFNLKDMGMSLSNVFHILRTLVFEIAQKLLDRFRTKKLSPERLCLRGGEKDQVKKNRENSVSTFIRVLAAKKVFIPLLYHYWKVPVFSYYQQLSESEGWSSKRLVALQEAKLIEIMQHAFLHIPYYHTALTQMGIAIDDLEDPKTLCAFPILAKKIVQENFSELIDPNQRTADSVVEHSGGSTGQPTKVKRDLNARAAVHAATWRANRWMGWKLGEPWMWLWGRLGTTTLSRKSVVLNWYKAKGAQEVFFNVHGLNREKLLQFARMMQSLKPRVIIGYTNAIYHLCLLIKEEGIQLPSPQGIATTAETLFPHQRQLVEEVFGGQVFNRYASSEVGLIASECETHDGLHVVMENVYLECIHEDGSPVIAGQPGRILVTDLNNRVMPLIRYDLGDVGVVGSSACRCGRPHQRLEKITGRTSDILKLPQGRIVFPDDLAEIFYPIDAIRQFQVIQEALAKIKVLLVLDSNKKIQQLAKLIHHQVKAAVGKEVEVELAFVDDIPILPSGKHRICISKI